MERSGENDNGATFDWVLDGPDTEGFLWIHSYGLSINLGPAEKAMSRLAQELGKLDFGG